MMLAALENPDLVDKLVVVGGSNENGFTGPDKYFNSVQTFDLSTGEVLTDKDCSGIPAGDFPLGVYSRGLGLLTQNVTDGNKGLLACNMQNYYQVVDDCYRYEI